MEHNPAGSRLEHALRGGLDQAVRVRRVSRVANREFGEGQEARKEMLTHWIAPRRAARRTLPPSLFTSPGFASLDRFFDDVWGGFSDTPAAEKVAFTPRVDVDVTDEAIRLTAELPGLDDGDFEVSIDEDLLTIKGEKKNEGEVDQRRTSLIERSHGRFERRFRLGWEVDPDRVKASYRQGVLELVIPKPEQPDVRTVPVTS